MALYQDGVLRAQDVIKTGRLKSGDEAMFSQAERGQSEMGLADTLAYVQSHPRLHAIGT